MAKVFKSKPDKFGFYYKLKFYEYSGVIWYSVYKKGKFFKIWPYNSEYSSMGHVARDQDEPADAYVGRVKNEALEQIAAIQRDMLYRDEVVQSLNHAWNVMIEKLNKF
jgi:hypothetical protein